MPAKVFVFGVDAMEPKLILEWMASGDLPNLARLWARGAWGTVLNPPRFFSGATWPSFYTGVGPARHGQYMRTAYDLETCVHRPLRPAFDLVPPFWRRPEWHGKRTAIFNVPYCSVDESINGLQVAGWRSHDRHLGHQAKIFPAQLAADVFARFGQHDPANCESLDFATSTSIDLRDRLITHLRQKAQVISEQLAAAEWDLFVSGIDECHCAGHRFWHLHDPTHPLYDPDEVAVVGDALRQVYVEVDRTLGDVLGKLGADSTIIFLSSHGMGPAFDGIPALDEILRRLDGLARRDPDYREQRVEQLARAGGRVDRLPGVLRRALAPLRKRFGRGRLGERMDEERRRRRFFWFPTHDLSGGIRINLAGREAGGIVQPGAQCDRVVAELTHDLHQLRDGRSGEPMVAQVLSVRDVDYTGYDGEMPDLIVRWAKASVWWIESPKIGRIDPVLSRGRTGDHDPAMQGLFCAVGPRIPPGPLASPVRLEDFAATISSRLGLRLGDTEGQPIAPLVAADPVPDGLGAG
jgi:predicted AlkP superfamily phosphohydrolase/phosphomutase